MFACIYSQQIAAEVSATTPAGQSGSLADFAYAFSPLVEETAPDTAVIDVEGCGLRFGSAYELAIEITKQAKAKKPCGLECKVNVALAANPDAAIYAARNFKGLTFIAPGEELTALGELPIESLLSSPKSNVQSPMSKEQTSSFDLVLESLSSKKLEFNFDQLKVGKAGLPPLFDNGHFG